MKYVVNFVLFWYDFIVGDDWTIAAGVIVALVLTAVLVQTNVVAWLWLPLAVAALLGASVIRLARASQRH
jgi:hypothetical protein